MKHGQVVLVLAFVMPALALGQNNADLAAMFTADQADRRGDNIDWEVVSAHDAERRTAVLSILSAGEIRTEFDYYNAAMIFQHGDTEEDIRMAHAFATISAALANTAAENWLKAASWDRLMLRYEQPQWYGTQYIRDASGRWELYEVNPDAVTDEQRAEWSVPSLAEARARVAQMNGER